MINDIAKIPSVGRQWWEKEGQCYQRISFVSHLKPLRESVWKGLSELGFHPKIRNNRSVQLEREIDIIDYFRIVGTSNPKHRQRYKEFLVEV